MTEKNADKKDYSQNRIVGTRLFYIVPFYFDEQPPICNGTIYKKICEHISSRKGWHGVSEINKWYRITDDGHYVKEDKPEETDIYQYILDSFYENVDDPGNTHIGKTWEYDIAGDEEGKSYICYKTASEEYDLTVENLGISLFRSGIGFIWYELTEKTEGGNRPLHEISVKALSEIQKNLKELHKDLPENVRVESRKYGDVRAIGLILNEVIRNVTGLDDTRIKYFASRIYSNGEYIPDKALMYTYAVLKESDVDTDSAYYIGRGNPTDYPIEKNMDEKIYKPFDDKIWYITREGCGYFVSDDDRNYNRTTLSARFVSNYFPLYLFLLHQSYSLQHYSEIMSTMLCASADSRDHTKEQISELDEFISEISTFLMKGIYASVAHIENVNEFYVYAQQRLHIKEDISSITVGLEALSSQQHNEHDRQEQEKDKRMSDSLAVISVLAIFSALSDGWAVAKDFMSEPLKLPRMILLIVILIITAVVSIFAVYVLIIMIKTRVCDIWNNVKRRKK